MKNAALLIVTACLAGTSFADSGTKLSIVAEAGAPVCSGDNTSATLTITTAATSSGSAAPAALSLSTDGGGTFTQVATVATTDWSGSGRTKTAEKTIPLTISASASTAAVVCFTQPGANGNPQKQACSELTLSAHCTPACIPEGHATPDSSACCSGRSGLADCDDPDSLVCKPPPDPNSTTDTGGCVAPA